MADPNVHEIGRLEDADGCRLVVGVDYDLITLSYGGAMKTCWRLTSGQAEEFGRLFIAACWQAAVQGPEVSGG